MLINGFIDLKEKIDTDIGNFYIGRFSKNTIINKSFDLDLFKSDLYVLMEDNSIENMLGFCCMNEYTTYVDYDNNKEYISGIKISCDCDEDRYYIYKTMMTFLHEKFPDKGFIINECNHLQIKVAKELGFEVAKKIPEYGAFNCNGLLMSYKSPVKKYKVITLCGSTRFKDEFIKMTEKLTLEGNIVISVGLFGHADNKFGTIITPEVKQMLDEIHKEKIRMSDEIFVINKDHYIGESTRNEIKYAESLGLKVTYMESDL